MERRIRRLGIFIVLCFLALFVQLNNIQVLRANSLATSPNNPRIITVQRSETRGSILSSDGVTLASSVLAPPNSIYKYQRVYNPQTANLFSQITGFAPSIFGNNYGIESEYNNYLTPHTRPAKTLRDLLVNRTEVDNVTLTISTKLQSQVAAAINQDAPGVNGAAAVVMDPTTGAIEAMYSNPSFDPNTLVSQNIKSDEFYWTALNKLQFLANPLIPGTYDQLNAPGSSFKVVTTSAVLEHSPALTNMIYPSVASVDLPGTGTPAQKLTNYHSEVCPGPNEPGTLEQLVIESCDANFASIGQVLGAPTLVGQAEQYGFNGKVPLDVPSDTVATSNFGTVASFDPEDTGVAGLMKSAIGQENVTASTLQMAMVAGTVANGGKEMTPHLMAQIHDTQGSLVTSYTPSVWKTPIQPSTAATLTTFMQGVVQKGTAANVFPASWNVAAKTGTAQTGSFSADPPFTTDWLIAFAPVGQSKVAIAVVVPNQPGSATGATVSGPIVKQILGDVLADQS
jgi:peptidoglycan glycosyltransferase